MLLVSANCSKREEVYAVADKVRQDVGDVTILVNNAGIVTGKKFMDSPDNMIIKTMEVNSLAHFWVSIIVFGKFCNSSVISGMSRTKPNFIHTNITKSFINIVIG